MATKSDEIIVLLRADISRLEGSLNTANTRLSEFRKKADTELSLGEASLRRWAAAAVSLAAVWGSIRIGRGIVEAGVQMQAMEAKMRAATGSAVIAAEAMQYVRDIAERLGLNIQSTADGFSSFSAAALRAGLTFQETKDIFTGVSEAATAMRLSNERVQLVFMALSQMASKGQVSMEELRQQLGESMPGAIQLFAKAMGVGNAEFIKMVQNGEVTTRDLIKFGQGLKNEFGSAAEQAASSAQAAFNRFGNARFDLAAKMANNGFLDAITDATNRLTDKLNDPGTQDGLAKFATLLGDIAEAAVSAASALGTMHNSANRAIESIGNKIFSGLFGEEGQKALDLARFKREHGDDYGTNAGNSAYGGNAELDAMLAEAKISGSNGSGNYTLNSGPQGESTAAQQKRQKLERLQEQMRGKVDTIRRSNAGQSDPGKQAALEYAAQQKELDKALELKAISEQAHRDASLEAEIAYQDKLTETRQRASDLEVDMRGKALNSISGLMNVFAGKNKAIAIAMLAFDKARAISQAIMETHVAAAAALKYDPTGATSARVTMMGYANVAAIAATGIAQLATMGGGGGGEGGSYSSGSGGGGFGGGGSSSGPTAQKTINVTLVGSEVASWSKNQIRELMDLMNDAGRDGSTLTVSLA